MQWWLRVYHTVQQEILRVHIREPFNVHDPYAVAVIKLSEVRYARMHSDRVEAMRDKQVNTTNPANKALTPLNKSTAPPYDQQQNT